MRPAIRNFIAVFIIAVVALAWYGMIKDGHASAAEAPGAPSAAICPSVAETARQVMVNAPDPHTSNYNEILFQADARQVATLVVQNPQCYDTTTVATAIQALTGINH